MKKVTLFRLPSSLVSSSCKSSLTNAILGEERVIVSNIEGTTRDAIDTPFVKDGQKYRVVDTAGMRKKGKVYENIEKYSILRALTSIEKSDVILVVIDGETGIGSPTPNA